ncbi:hypothetical protein XM38_046060 [Halomicronema hongdechloris C2206]|uniref:Uncharacterized protein n=1 Tax=Halomicronema hongdechloris C2206 TaxID=1641165 RepID=A0A1Z3HTM2_9CYAN|nr:hypothetical protein [Halomicronema hongdechloris]ASC73635.1 hypothetical protein XM38_046060 [Halomicronema hongdechloris C2206]
MASPESVRDYLAHWFQLGKPVVIHNGDETRLPQPIFQGNRYSPAFEACWQQILATDGQGCYLAGSNESLATLLSSAWDITDCARCRMPVTTPVLGVSTGPCPCHDIVGWPNTELPAPRLSVDTQSHLKELQTRLQQVKGHPDAACRQPYEPADVAKAISGCRGTA